MGLQGIVLAALALPVAAQDPEVQPPLVSVPFEKVRFTSGLWAERLAKNAETTVPLVLAQCEATGRIANFDLAAGGERKGHTGRPWDDADVYRALEAVAHTLALEQDEELAARADAIIARIAAAQDEDGYLATYVMVERPGARWDDIQDGYELFCAGHLIEAGIAYAQATGKDSLLDVAVRLADHVDATFGPEGRVEPPGHQEIELALAKLHAHTGEERYLKRAEYFLARRGERDERELWGPDYQDVLPVRQQFAVTGNAVRTMYQLCGMADVYAATRDYSYMAPLINCWKDVTEKRMYVTGAVGSSAKTEGFTVPYDLPNQSAWCETCASIGMAMWQRRMLTQTRQAAYADVLERVLYNALLGGVSQEGDAFFYDNPMESPGGISRSPWYPKACCPTNFARFLPTIGGSVYAQDEDDVYVVLFAASETEIQLEHGRVGIRQATSYPWDGKVVFEIVPEQPMEFALHVRAPAWCVDPITAGVNGATQDVRIDRGDYLGFWLTYERKWKRGDKLEIVMPMPVRRVHADERVAANAGRVALQRGPLVYAFEGADNGGHARHLSLPPDAALEAKLDEKLFGGTVVIQGPGKARSARGAVADTLLTAIPYHRWGNRGPNEMVVWIPERAAEAAAPGAGASATQGGVRISASHSYRHHTLTALVDGILPKDSYDQTIPRMTFLNHVGSKEWIVYEFSRERMVDSSNVYWYDDASTGDGFCKPPRSWRLFWRRGEEWLPVKLRQGEFYFRMSNRFNEVKFEPVKTTAVRMELELDPAHSAGVLEWQVLDAN